MKRVLIIVVLVVAAAVLGLWRSHGGVRAGLSRVVGAGDENAQGTTADDIRRSFDLKAGALVQVQGINGKVDIETSDSKTAEVYVHRTADSADALSRREIIVEQTSDGFVVRSKQNSVGLWNKLFGRNPKEEVTIKAPRDVSLSLKGINGHVNTGYITGSLEMRGVNGGAELGSASGSVEISGINGSFSVGLRQLGEHGARISGVNGNVELKLASGLNADLNARGMNGRVTSDITEVTVERENAWSNYSSRIGKGGPLIDLSGINGNVRLTRGETTATSSSETKSTSDKGEKSPAKAGMSAQ